MFSVVIPFYNSKMVISKSIESVLNQKDVEGLAEIICVDDGSSDGSSDYLSQQYGDSIRLIRLTRNRGPAAARNIGFSHATGDYIAVLDSDDYFEPDRLSTLRGIIKDYHPDVLLDGSKYVRSDRCSLYPRSFWFAGLAAKLPIYDFVARDLGPLKPVFKRHFLIENHISYDESLKYSEDFDFMFKCYKKSASVVISGYYGYCRVLRLDSLSRNIELGINIGFLKTREYLAFAREKPDRMLEQALYSRIWRLRKAVIKNNTRLAYQKIRCLLSKF